MRLAALFPLPLAEALPSTSYQHSTVLLQLLLGLLPNAPILPPLSPQSSAALVSNLVWPAWLCLLPVDSWRVKMRGMMPMPAVKRVLPTKLSLRSVPLPNGERLAVRPLLPENDVAVVQTIHGDGNTCLLSRGGAPGPEG